MTCALVSGQTNQDSLKQVWNDPLQADTSRIDAVHILIRSHLYSEPSQAETYITGLLHFADSIGDPYQRALATNYLGILDQMTSAYEKALGHYNDAIDIAKESELGSLLSGLLINAGTIYYQAKGDHETAIQYINEGIEASRKYGYPKFIANAHTNLGAIYRDLGQLEESFDQFNQAFQIADSLELKGNIAGAHLGMGTVMEKKGDLNQAIDYFMKSLKASEELGNKYEMTRPLSNIGVAYMEQKDYENALLYFNRSLTNSKELGDQHGISSGLSYLGNVYVFQGQDSLALSYFLESLKIAEEIEETYSITNVLPNIGNVYLRQGKYDLAEQYYQRSLKLEREIGTQPLISSSLINLGKLHYQKNQLNQAISLGNEALSIAQAIQSPAHIRDAALHLYKSYKSTKNTQKALEMYELHQVMKDSLFNEDNQRAVIQQGFQYEYEKQALTDSLAFVQQQAATELSYQRQLSRRNYLLFGGLGLALLAFLFFRYRQQLRNRQKELELQQERQRKEQLVELNGLKSRFFANISHEFRTPLTLVLGRNQMMQAQLDDPALDAQFDEVDRNGRRLLELVNQVLDLSKLEAGNMHLQTETIDLVPFLKNILFSFESLADQKAQKLEFESEHESLLIVADPEKLERVFYNLLANAIKFTPRQGKINLQLQVISNRAHIKVKDNGKGIPEAELPFVFNRFYQSTSNQEQTSPGTGIGLALAKELVELHKGSLQVESQLDVGSTFWAELPLDDITSGASVSHYEPQLEPVEKIDIAQKGKVVPAATQQQAKVLVVEDNPDVRAYLRDELLSLGYEVMEAENGKEGLEQAQQSEPALIISDVMMPRMDGFEFAEAIRKDVQSSHIPIILLTAKASEESKLEGLKIGADAYLTKPFKREELKVRVAKLIEQRQHLRQRFSTAMQIKPEEVSAVPMDQAFLQKLTAFIEENLSNDQFGVEPLAEHTGMSSAYLKCKLNALNGQSTG